ncbi:MAG: ATP-binding cassette domain-containing protein [Desulfuromonas sp.]|nr:ATP-binding cassette domain-containing protein [Desulfuromonas sp.]
MKLDLLFNTPLVQLLKHYPYVSDFLDSFALSSGGTDVTLDELFGAITADQWENIGLNNDQLRQSLLDYVAGMGAIHQDFAKVERLTVVGGFDKDGGAENCEIELIPGQVTCIVGATGSGKSRLLADIEWVAQGDTPTGRHILINGQVPDAQWRFSIEHKLVAQLSQNMNFVMDLTVAEFVRMHAESRFVPDVDDKIEQIIAQANDLAGEVFSVDTPITALSGGQSRALMIADTAILSKSPIVLIDEIENAGIDRKKALDLLVKEEKIVLMATHDPILALMGQRRLVIKNGGVAKIITTSAAERANLTQLEILDRQLMALRQRIRSGETLEKL